MNIVMLASENDSLPAAKVGGIGDVLRDLPPALAAQGHQIHVVLPAYHHLASIAGMKHAGEVEFSFAGEDQTVKVLRLNDSHAGMPGVSLWVLESPLFAVGEKGSIYHHDADNAPFATDASLFAMFCASALSAIKSQFFGSVDVLHLHDWHAAMAALLIRHDERFASMRKLHTVFTIHNLSLQGVRPFKGHPSSLENWFPDLKYPAEQICDPRSPDCINLMRVGVRYNDKLHVVSPTYAEEVTRPSDPTRGFFGGEGLEADLLEAKKQQRLVGILNGCEYPETPAVGSRHLPDLFDACARLLLNWVGRSELVSSAHFIAEHRLRDFKNMPRSMFLMTSVGRITAQKMALLRYPFGNKVALEILLDELEGQGALVIVGSGDAGLESFLIEISSRYANLLYLRGYAEQVSEMLYEMGDLFLMPSSFEPCGISQMLAMRAGQPCLVHAVGGLKDTVKDNIDGFCFSGPDPGSQAQAMIANLKKAMQIHAGSPDRWQEIKSQARQARFLWKDSARKCIEQLYQPTLPTPTPTPASDTRAKPTTIATPTTTAKSATTPSVASLATPAKSTGASSVAPATRAAPTPTTPKPTTTATPTTATKSATTPSAASLVTPAKSTNASSVAPATRTAPVPTPDTTAKPTTTATPIAAAKSTDASSVAPATRTAPTPTTPKPATTTSAQTSPTPTANKTIVKPSERKL